MSESLIKGGALTASAKAIGPGMAPGQATRSIDQKRRTPLAFSDDSSPREKPAEAG
jgi:hypothetical protein